MKINDEILINQYAQDVITNNPIVEAFKLLEIDEKRMFLSSIINLIQQSKPKDEDISQAIECSGIKSTHTPCIMLRKGVNTHNLLTISRLPEYELIKVLILFLSLFKIAYQRRYIVEKDFPSKWWYWDLSDNNKVTEIKMMTSPS